MAPSVPPVTTMSPVLPFQAKLLVASENVKVMVAVSPALTAPTLLLMASVGANVSMLIGRVPAALVLPAASVWVALRISVPSPMAVMSALTRV